MKNLYNDDDTYTYEAANLDEETHDAIVSIFNKYVKEGHSIRQISQVMQMTVIDLELSSILSTKK